MMSKKRPDVVKVLLLLFMGSLCVLSSVSAIPATRSLVPKKETDYSIHEVLLHQGVESKVMSEDVIEVGEALIEGRMDIESNDYPGTGANHNHDPKTPGRA